MFVRVARKSIQVPELELAVQDGLQMSKAKTIASVIDSGNKVEWIEKAQSLSKEKLEREVAAANPSAPKPEKAKPTGPDRVRVEFEVTYEEAELLKRARELMSQKKSKHAQIGETFVYALKDWVDREDPIRKAERAKARQEKSAPQTYSSIDNINETGSAVSSIDPTRINVSRHRSRDRSPIPAAILHQVYLRDRGACRKRMLDGSNCGCRRWVDVHHIKPKAQGGQDTIENLITLCRAHHRQLHYYHSA